MSLLVIHVPSRQLRTAHSVATEEENGGYNRVSQALHALSACLLTGGFSQSRYGSDGIERLDVYKTSIGTSTERPVFDADELGVETRYFSIVDVKKSVVLHGP